MLDYRKRIYENYVESRETPLAPKGATGWGVMALDRMIRDTCEGR